MRRSVVRAGSLPRSDVAFGKLLFRESDSTGGSFSIFAPQHYESKYAYPLLVWLHGSGGNERQIQRVMPLISMRNYVGVAPSLPATTASPGCGVPDESDSAAVDEAIRSARKRFHIRKDGVFLVGWGNGGTVALQLGMSEPERYAGIVSLNGPFPRHPRSLARLDAARRLPLLLSTGADSRSYPPAQVCEDLRLLHAAGLRVALRQYPVGDELTTVMLSDVNHWVMEVVTGSTLCK